MSNNNSCYSGPYYPNNVVTCRSLQTCSVGRITNPDRQLEWGIFNLTESTQLDSGENIPVRLTEFNGTAISQVDENILLTPGLYRVSYNVNAIITADEIMTIGLKVNGVNKIGSETIVTGPSGQNVNLATSLLLNLFQNSNVSLSNLTNQAISVSTANLSINKITT